MRYILNMRYICGIGIQRHGTKFWARGISQEYQVIRNSNNTMKRNPKNTVNFENFISHLKIVDIQANLFPFYCFSSYSQIYHELKYSPQIRCMSMCMCIYQLLNDEYWKSISLCGKIYIEFVCNNVTLCFEHGKCTILVWVFVCLKHRMWHDIDVIQNRFEYCCRNHIPTGIYSFPPALAHRVVSFFLYFDSIAVVLPNSLVTKKFGTVTCSV